MESVMDRIARLEELLESARAQADHFLQEKERLGDALKIQCDVAVRALESAGQAVAERDAARQLSEQLQVQLAGVSVVAMGGLSPEVSAKRGDYGWSQTYEDVRQLRIKYERLARAVGEA